MTGINKRGGARPGAGRKKRPAPPPIGPATDLHTTPPEKIETEADVAKLARSFAPVAIRRLAAIAQHGKSEAASVAAANALLDRGFGRRPLIGDLNRDGDLPPAPPATSSDKPQGQLPLSGWEGLLQ